MYIDMYVYMYVCTYTYKRHIAPTYHKINISAQILCSYCQYYPRTKHMSRHSERICMYVYVDVCIIVITNWLSTCLSLLLQIKNPPFERRRICRNAELTLGVSVGEIWWKQADLLVWLRSCASKMYFFNFCLFTSLHNEFFTINWHDLIETFKWNDALMKQM